MKGSERTKREQVRQRKIHKSLHDPRIFCLEKTYCTEGRGGERRGCEERREEEGRGEEMTGKERGDEEWTRASLDRRRDKRREEGES